MPRYFQPSEYQCKCNRPECDAPTQLTQSLSDLLDAIRESTNQPLRITSGIRCKALNDTLADAVKDSEHLTGEAVDLATPDSHTRWLVLNALGKLSAVRYGVGMTFVHVGVSAAHDQSVAWTYYKQGAA